MTDSTNPLDDVTSTAVRSADGLTESVTTARTSKPKKAPTATELAIKQVNGIVGDFDSVAAGLADLATKYKNTVYAVATTKGMEEAKAARMEVREARFKVQRALEAAKSPLNTLKADITARANEIIAQITPLEDPIDAQIKAEEKRKADEKAERERVEAEARAAIDAQVEAIRGFVINSTGMSSADIAGMIEGVERIVVELEVFGDRTGEAQQVKAKVLEQLAIMRDNAAAMELERAELARQQEEMRAAQEAEQKRQAEARAAEAQRLADERAALEKERAEMKAQAEAMAAERKAIDDAKAAEQRRIDEAAAAERRRVEDAERAERMQAEEAERAARAAKDAVERAAREEEAEAARLEQQRKGEERERAEAADKKMRDAAALMLKAHREIRDLAQPGDTIWTIADGAIFQATAKE